MQGCPLAGSVWAPPNNGLRSGASGRASGRLESRRISGGGWGARATRALPARLEGPTRIAPAFREAEVPPKLKPQTDKVVA
eukprot:79930-Pyramimonas_sp.AAC.1